MCIHVGMLILRLFLVHGLNLTRRFDVTLVCEFSQCMISTPLDRQPRAIYLPNERGI